MCSGLPAGFAWIQRLGERPGIVLYTYQRRLLALHANIARREENGTSLRHFGSFFPAGHIKSTLEILSIIAFHLQVDRQPAATTTSPLANQH